MSAPRDTQLTVGQVRRYYGDIAGIATPPDTTDYFLRTLNPATERLINSGKWKGMIMELLIQPQITELGLLGNGANGYITLPRHYLGVTFMRFGCRPAPVFAESHTYVEVGPGQVNPSRPTIGILIDQGDGWCTQNDIPANTAATIQIGITNAADAGQTIRVFGLDANYCPIFDEFGEGFNIVTAFPVSAPNGQAVTKLTGLQGPIQGSASLFKGNWSLSYVQNGHATQIGQYQPSEQFPSYRRYLCQNLMCEGSPSGPGPTAIPIWILAQRRYVELVAETDWVIPGSLNALKYALLATQIDDAIDNPKAGAYWNQAYSMLNEYSRAARAGARYDAEISSAQGGDWAFGWGGNGMGGGGYGFGGTNGANVI